MSKAVAPKPTPVPEYDLTAGILGYLVPGLGQIVQGRLGKGLLFLVCIYGLFFYGIYLGTDSVLVAKENAPPGEASSYTEYHVGGNVYLPDNADRVNPFGLRVRLLANLYNRPQFLGQFWVGIAAWPAIWQYLHYDEQAELALRSEITEMRRDGKDVQAEALEKKLRQGDTIFGQYQRAPTDEANNAVQNYSDKLFDLSWVYSVIAGVLNIMVIYDAMAGPAFPTPRPTPSVNPTG